MTPQTGNLVHARTLLRTACDDLLLAIADMGISRERNVGNSIKALRKAADALGLKLVEKREA